MGRWVQAETLLGGGVPRRRPRFSSIFGEVPNPKIGSPQVPQRGPCRWWVGGSRHPQVLNKKNSEQRTITTQAPWEEGFRVMAWPQQSTARPSQPASPSSPFLLQNPQQTCRARYVREQSGSVTLRFKQGCTVVSGWVLRTPP